MIGRHQRKHGAAKMASSHEVECNKINDNVSAWTTSGSYLGGFWEFKPSPFFAYGISLIDWHSSCVLCVSCLIRVILLNWLIFFLYILNWLTFYWMPINYGYTVRKIRYVIAFYIYYIFYILTTSWDLFISDISFLSRWERDSRSRIVAKGSRDVIAGLLVSEWRDLWHVAKRFHSYHSSTELLLEGRL